MQIKAARLCTFRDCIPAQNQATMLPSTQGLPAMTDTNERRETYRRTEDIYRKAIEEIRDYAIFLTDADGITRPGISERSTYSATPKKKSSARTEASCLPSRTGANSFPKKSWR